MDGGNVVFKFKGETSDLEKKTSALQSKLGGVASTIGSAFLKGTAVAGAAVSAVVATSVKSFADVEQSIGGIETIFGDSAGAIEENAKKAFQTAGLSANEYMEQATSFSASLLQSLGGDTEKAASVADMAITDMADNANKMGTSIDSIQVAYQGFAKQNYTMLDNLKLGYGGTKDEMDRLLSDASKLTGQKYDISNLNDVYQAIHAIQGEMGITGTTANEASTTISGSVASAKSAWSNFLSGTGGIDDVISTFITAGTNIGNAIIKMLPQVTTGLVALVNALIPQLPTIINTILPTIIQGALTLIQGLITAMPSIITALLGMLPMIVTTLTSMLPTILESLIQMSILIIQTLAEQAPILIPQIVDAIIDCIPILIDNLPLFIDAGFQLIIGILKGIVKAAPSIIAGIIYLGDEMLKFLGSLPYRVVEIGSNIVTGLWDGIGDKVEWIKNKIEGFGTAVIDKIKNIFGVHSPSKVMFSIGGYLDKGFINGIEDMSGEIDKTMAGTFNVSPSLYDNANAYNSPNVVVNVNNNMRTDALGQLVNDVKTFSGGSKNDYNYGMGV